MNYEQANSVKDLAPGVNKVLEELDVECPECKGKRYVIEPISGPAGVTPREVPCPACKTKGKVKWKWQPKVGECFYGLSKKLHWIVNEKQRLQLTAQLIKDKYITPILPWEEIERVLEKAGYFIEVRKEYQDKGNIKIWCRIWGKTGYAAAPLFFGKSRQQAVMKAIIALGKELKQ